jgi:ABC-2 type transport system permease protein
LLRAGAIGRFAPVAAALAVVAATDMTITVVVALGLIALGLPAAGSLALGAWLGAVGLVFAGVGAVAAQMTDNARSAYGIAGAALAVAYVLRAVGDAGHGTLSWLSPIGWAKATRPFDDERWWALLLCVAAFALLVAAAFALLARRDLGAGLIASRPGPPVAGRDLRNTLGLAFRLQRGSLSAWSTSPSAFSLRTRPCAAGGLPGGWTAARAYRDRARARRRRADCLLPARRGLSPNLGGSVA